MSGGARPNLLVTADAARACDLLPPHIGFDLVYLDPPYGVGTTMSARTAKGERRGRKQRASGPDAYDDTLGVDALVGEIARVVDAIRARMNQAAALYVHLDHRAVHDAKVAIDRVLGRGAFLGEIVWIPGNGGRGRGLSVTHQTLLVYARGDKDAKLARFDYDDPALREPYASTSLAMHFKQRDESGRAYRDRTIGGKTYRYYADRGRKRGSVWADLPAMTANTPLRSEATGYPTQKPESLLARVIALSSAPGDTVADLMCGSGTTLVAAARAGRAFVGGDASPLACDIAAKRLRAAGIAFEELRAGQAVAGGRAGANLAADRPPANNAPCSECTAPPARCWRSPWSRSARVAARARLERTPALPCKDRPASRAPPPLRSRPRASRRRSPRPTQSRLRSR
jgi:site-specific DNA-methyltransferase (adenine-specific)